MKLIYDYVVVLFNPGIHAGVEKNVRLGFSPSAACITKYKQAWAKAHRMSDWIPRLKSWVIKKMTTKLTHKIKTALRTIKF